MSQILHTELTNRILTAERRKYALNAPVEATLSRIPFDLEPSTSNVNSNLTLTSPKITRQRSIPVNKADLKRQRSDSGTRSITSYFSPSPSPKSAHVVLRSTIFRTATSLQQMTASDPDVATRNGRRAVSKRRLPGFSKDTIYERPGKRMKLNDTNDKELLLSVSDNDVQLVQSEPMDDDVIQPSEHLSLINTAPYIALRLQPISMKLSQESVE